MAVREIEQPPLERRRAEIGDEDLHHRVSNHSELAYLLQPLAQPGQSVVRTRNHLHADDLADLGRGGRAGVGGGFHGGDVAAEKRGDVAAADFFPAGERDVGRFERGVAGFEQGAQALCIRSFQLLVEP